MHGEVSVDHALLLPLAHANVDLVSVLSQNFLLVGFFSEDGSAELGTEPALESTHFGFLIGLQPELERLLRVPEVFHAGPRALPLVERFPQIPW